MLLAQEKNSSGYIIRSYHPGNLVINDVTYTHSLVLSPEVIIESWPPQDITQLAQQDLQVLIEQNPEVVILGTGATQQFPPVEILALLIQKNLGYEIMDTAAACRTYNLLASEKRHVVAGLIIA